MNGRAIPGAYLFRLYVCDKEMSWPHHKRETHQIDWVVYVRDSEKFRLTNVIPERIILVSRGITVLLYLQDRRRICGPSLTETSLCGSYLYRLRRVSLWRRAHTFIAFFGSPVCCMPAVLCQSSDQTPLSRPGIPLALRLAHFMCPSFRITLRCCSVLFQSSRQWSLWRHGYVTAAASSSARFVSSQSVLSSSAMGGEMDIFISTTTNFCLDVKRVFCSELQLTAHCQESLSSVESNTCLFPVAVLCGSPVPARPVIKVSGSANPSYVKSQYT